MDKDLEFDTVLADYCPDIARLIRVDCTPFAENCSIEGDKATVSGKAVYDVLYETDYKSKLKYCSFTQEFSHGISIPKNSATDITAFCNIKCQRINCKLLSPRRLVIKAVLGILFDIEGDTPVKAIAVNEDSETFFLKKTIGFDGRTAEHTENFRCGDSLGLTQNEKNIGEVLFGRIDLQEPQISLSPGSAEIKTSATVHALCEDEDNEGKYFSVAKTIPLNLEFRNNAIEDYKEVSIKLEPMEEEFKPELDQYGESRMIKTDFIVKATLKINEPKAYTVATDLFEKGFDSICTKGNAVMPKVFANEKTSFSAEAKINDITPKIQALLDCTLRENGVVFEKAEGGIKLVGSFTVTMLAETSEGIYSFDHNLPYEQFIQAEIPQNDCDIQVEVVPTEVISTLHSDGSVTARIIAGVSAKVFTRQEESFLAEVAKRVPAESEEDPSAIIYRFPHKGEELWDIAKSYRTSPESILDSNPESFDENGKLLPDPKPILIKT